MFTLNLNLMVGLGFNVVYNSKHVFLICWRSTQVAEGDGLLNR